jgi:predicted peptidase
MDNSLLSALAVAGLLGAALATGRAAEPAHGFLDRVFRKDGGTESKYVLFVPHDYKGDKPYPLILFLHGAGETGSDGKLQVQVGLGPVVRAREKSFPFFVLFPQSHKRTWQASTEDAGRALAMLHLVEKEYKIDPKRIYLTGLSMGGYGTWSLAAADPERWAAIAPVCGGGDPKTAARITDVPCWCFHGDQDRAVPVERSREMIAALKSAGGQPRYTEYPFVGHNSWDPTYNTPELFPWLLSHQRK